MGNQKSSAAGGAAGGGGGGGAVGGGGGRGGTLPTPQRMTLKEGYDQLVHAFIRPSRAQYNVSDLGPQSFRVGVAWFERTDLLLINLRGLNLACSFWEPKGAAATAAAADEAFKAASAAAAASADTAALEASAAAATTQQQPEQQQPPQQPQHPQRPCVIYLHGNSSCRAGALEMLPALLAAGFVVFAFDFAGCGLSDGEYISLGFFEKDDVATVVQCVVVRLSVRVFLFRFCCSGLVFCFTVFRAFLAFLRPSHLSSAAAAATTTTYTGELLIVACCPLGAMSVCAPMCTLGVGRRRHIN